MKINFSGQKPASSKETPASSSQALDGTLSKIGKAIVDNARVGVPIAFGGLSVAGAVLIATLSAYQAEPGSSLEQAMMLSEDFEIYKGNSEKLQVDIVSLLDARFEGLDSKPGFENEKFLRDVLIGNHQLACGRDEDYASEIGKRGQLYLGCSITPGAFSEGIEVSTYSYGSRMEMTYSEDRSFLSSIVPGTHLEKRRDYVFPKDIRTRAEAIPGPDGGVTLVRAAMTFQGLSHGFKPWEMNKDFADAFGSMLAVRGVSTHWNSLGKSNAELLNGLASLGVFPQPHFLDRSQFVTSMDNKLGSRSMSSPTAIEFAQGAIRDFTRTPSYKAINDNLDHHCALDFKQRGINNIRNLNTACALEAGIQPSLSIAYEFKRSNSDRVLLGTYKGYPVVTSFAAGKGENPTIYGPQILGYVHSLDSSTSRLAFSKDNSWASRYISTDELGGGGDLKPVQAFEHFGHEFSARHIPIFINPRFVEASDLGSLSTEHHRMAVEMTLEHEIKHVLDISMALKMHRGSLDTSAQDQQISCDLYAIQMIADKYKDSEKLKVLRDVIQHGLLSFAGHDLAAYKPSFMSKRLQMLGEKNAGSWAPREDEVRLNPSQVEFLERRSAALEFVALKIRELESDDAPGWQHKTTKTSMIPSM